MESLYAGAEGQARSQPTCTALGKPLHSSSLRFLSCEKGKGIKSAITCLSPLIFYDAMIQLYKCGKEKNLVTFGKNLKLINTLSFQLMQITYA